MKALLDVSGPARSLWRDSSTQVTGVDVDGGAAHGVAIYRAGRIWDASTFDSSNVMNEQSPIADAVVSTFIVATGQQIAVESSAGTSYLPHSITHRDNHRWLADVGAHVVRKYRFENGAMELEGTYGELHAPGSDPGKLCKPTDVAISPDGVHAYISDGYCNSRVVKIRVDTMEHVATFGESSI